MSIKTKKEKKSKSRVDTKSRLDIAFFRNKIAGRNRSDEVDDDIDESDESPSPPSHSRSLTSLPTIPSPGEHCCLPPPPSLLLIIYTTLVMAQQHSPHPSTEANSPTAHTPTTPTALSANGNNDVRQTSLSLSYASARECPFPLNLFFFYISFI